MKLTDFRMHTSELEQEWIPQCTNSYSMQEIKVYIYIYMQGVAMYDI